jgi:hypothetical protein
MKFRCFLKDVKVGSGDVKEMNIKVQVADKRALEMLDIAGKSGYLEFIADEEPELDFDEEVSME